jgi:group I intron endonuclease
MIGVYAITHIGSQRVYIGSSGNIARRWAQHKTHLRYHKHSSQKLQRAWDKYGAGAFQFSILEECALEGLREQEQYWIDTLEAYNTGFNCTKKAKEHSEEVRKRLSEQKLGKKMSDEHRRKLSEAHKNSSFAPITAQMHTPEAKVKSVKARIGLKKSEETKKKIGEGQKRITKKRPGPMSEENKRKISLAKMGKPRSRETKEKLRNKVVSLEARKNMSEAAKARSLTSEGKQHHMKCGVITSAKRSNHAE